MPISGPELLSLPFAGGVYFGYQKAPENKKIQQHHVPRKFLHRSTKKERKIKPQVVVVSGKSNSKKGYSTMMGKTPQTFESAKIN
jgi:hypothetical protein